MKTKTSKTKMWTRSLVLLPLLAILVYSFSSNKKVEKYIASETSGINYIARSIEIEVQNGTYKIDGISATKETFKSIINQLHQDITPEIRNRVINIHVNNRKEVSDKEVWFIYNAVIDYGFHRIVTYNQEIIREKGNKPFAIRSSENQKGASKKQVAEYNALAKKYNKQPQNKRVVKLKDVKRLEYLYSLMSENQKNNAQPFPDCPPPPPPAPKPEKIEVVEAPSPPPASKNYKLREMKNGAPTPPKAPEPYKLRQVEETPPPPPPPKSPLDHVISMAKKGATFYYNGKSVSSDKAIELLKKNGSLNISTNTNDGKSVVKIQTEPIKH